MKMKTSDLPKDKKKMHRYLKSSQISLEVNSDDLNDRNYEQSRTSNREALKQRDQKITI